MLYKNSGRRVFLDCRDDQAHAARYREDLHGLRVIATFRESALMSVGFWSNDMVTEDIDISWKLQLKFWDIRYEPRALCWILMPETIKGLCRPVLIILLWLVSFRVFFRHMVDLGGLVGLQELKIFYISGIILIVFLIRGWNIYNKMRYGKKSRRKFVRGVSDAKLEEYFKLPQGNARQLQGTKEIDVDFREDHQIHIAALGKPRRSINGYLKPS